MRILLALLIIITLYLQYSLWFKRGGVREVEQLQAAVAEQRQHIQSLRERNHALAAEIIDLKQGLEAIEERARSDMGMIKEGEIFFRTNEQRNERAADLAPSGDTLTGETDE